MHECGRTEASRDDEELVLSAALRFLADLRAGTKLEKLPSIDEAAEMFRQLKQEQEST